MIVRKRQTERPAPAETSRSRSFYYSILLHAALVVVFVIGVDLGTRETVAPAPATSVIRATAVDQKLVEQEAQKLKQADERKEREAEQRMREAERKRREEEARLDKLKAEQEQVKQAKAAENRRLEAEKQRLEQEKSEAVAAKQKAQEEQQRMEAERAAAARRTAEEAERKAAEQKKQAEVTKRKAEAARREAEEAKKRKAEAARAEQALKDALAEEEAELAAARQASKDESELARYAARIKNSVTGGFVYPDLKMGLKCTLFVRVIPGGEVVEARVIESSGNAVFDRQAEIAVRKASPLPVPDDPRLFQKMHEFTFVFDPES